MNEIDQIVLHFDGDNLMLMNLSLGFIMFGVALQLTPTDFYRVFTQPKSALLGFIAQFLALPFITYLLILIIQPLPSIALGMMLVAACPGGNISNFMTSLAGGNTALSVSMTAVTSLLAVIMTPLNIAFWGGLYAPTSVLLESVSISFWEMAKIVGTILLAPMLMGMFVRQYWSTLAHSLHKYTQVISMVIFAVIVFLAFYANYAIFINYIHVVVLIVLLHNGSALLLGLGIGKLFKLSLQDQKTLSIETGIQNSGLGLGLIFTFFGGLGGMAMVAGWWGIWHIISGLVVAYYFKSKSMAIA